MISTKLTTKVSLNFNISSHLIKFQFPILGNDPYHRTLLIEPNRSNSFSYQWVNKPHLTGAIQTHVSGSVLSDQHDNVCLPVVYLNTHCVPIPSSPPLSSLDIFISDLRCFHSKQIYVSALSYDQDISANSQISMFHALVLSLWGLVLSGEREEIQAWV